MELVATKILLTKLHKKKVRIRLLTTNRSSQFKQGHQHWPDEERVEADQTRIQPSAGRSPAGSRVCATCTGIGFGVEHPPACQRCSSLPREQTLQEMPARGPVTLAQQAMAEAGVAVNEEAGGGHPRAKRLPLEGPGDDDRVPAYLHE